MDKMEHLRELLNDTKERLISEGCYLLGNRGYENLRDMKTYEIAFQDCIEKVFPDNAWWQVTNYWDIFQDILSGSNADEVINHIIEHCSEYDDRESGRFNDWDFEEDLDTPSSYAKDRKEYQDRLKHLKDLYDMEPGDLTDDELEELKRAGMLDEYFFYDAEEEGEVKEPVKSKNIKDVPGFIGLNTFEAVREFTRNCNGKWDVGYDKKYFDLYTDKGYKFVGNPDTCELATVDADGNFIDRFDKDDRRVSESLQEGKIGNILAPGKKMDKLLGKYKGTVVYKKSANKSNAEKDFKSIKEAVKFAKETSTLNEVEYVLIEVDNSIKNDDAFKEISKVFKNITSYIAKYRGGKAVANFIQNILSTADKLTKEGKIKSKWGLEDESDTDDGGDSDGSGDDTTGDKPTPPTDGGTDGKPSPAPNPTPNPNPPTGGGDDTTGGGDEGPVEPKPKKDKYRLFDDNGKTISHSENIDKLRKLRDRINSNSKSVIKDKDGNIVESCGKGKKKIKESWEGEGIIDDLVDRGKYYVDEGHDVDDAVSNAIDEGLIYSADILALAQHYGTLPDDSDLINDYYEQLFDDVYSELSHYAKEKQEEEQVELLVQYAGDDEASFEDYYDSVEDAVDYAESMDDIVHYQVVDSEGNIVAEDDWEDRDFDESLKEDNTINIDKVEVNQPNVKVGKGHGHHDQHKLSHHEKHKDMVEDVRDDKPLTKSPYKSIIGEYFEYSMDWEFLDIVASVLNGIDMEEAKEKRDDLFDLCWEAVDSELIYTEDQWTVFIEYIGSPSEVDSNSWDSAFEEFTRDIENIVLKIIGE